MLIAGDWNSGVGEEDDKLKIEQPQDPWEEYMKRLMDKIDKKRNKDKVLNTAGRKLVKLCKRTGLLIRNGRTKDDKEGNLTFISEGGTSAIDLIVAAPEFLTEKGLNTKIESHIISKHMPMEIWWYTNRRE